MPITWWLDITEIYAQSSQITCLSHSQWTANPLKTNIFNVSGPFSHCQQAKYTFHKKLLNECSSNPFPVKDGRIFNKWPASWLFLFNSYTLKWTHTHTHLYIIMPSFRLNSDSYIILFSFSSGDIIWLKAWEKVGGLADENKQSLKQGWHV